MRTVVHGRSDWCRFLELYSASYKELQHCFHHGLPRCRNGRESARDARDKGSIPGSEDSPGEGNSNTPQDSCLGHLIDRGVWWATIHGITRSWTRLSDRAYTHSRYHHGSSVMACHIVITLLVQSARGSRTWLWYLFSFPPSDPCTLEWVLHWIRDPRKANLPEEGSCCRCLQSSWK